jgi:hypothetical protein
MGMKEKNNQLLRRLHSRSLDPSLEEEFMKTRESSYDFLLEQLENKSLTDYQMMNILAILVKMMYVRSPENLIQKILNLLQDRRMKVRSMASNITISLLRRSEACEIPSYQLERERLKSLIKSAVLMGLDKSSESYALSFLKDEI